MNGVTPPQDHHSRTARLVRSVLHLGVGQAISTVLGFLLVVALGRVLGPSDLGILYAVATIYGFVAVLIDWGQSTYAVREIASGRSDEAEFIGAALIVRVIGNLGAAAIGTAGAWALGYDGLTILLVALASVIGFPGSLGVLIGLLFRAKDRMDLDVFIGLVGKISGVAAVVAVLALGGGLFGIVAASAVGSIASFILSICLLLRFGIRVRLPDLKLVRELFWIGTPIAIMSAAMGLQSFVDVTILSLLTGPAAVGWLGASRTMLGIFLAPAGILATATFPELSRAASSVPDLHRILSSSARIALAAGACAASALYIFADFGVSITYGHGKFEQVAVLLLVTSPFLPLFFLNFLVANAVFAVRKMVAMAVAKVFFVTLGAIVSWFAVSYFQDHSANGAIGIIVSYGFMEPMMLIAMFLMLPKGAFDFSILFHLIRAYVTFGAVVLGAAALPPLPALVLAPIFGLAFAVAGLATRLVLGSDISRVIAVMKSSALKYGKHARL
jgi:O-antigen/teichoic acid export membrane protein